MRIASLVGLELDVGMRQETVTNTLEAASAESVQIIGHGSFGTVYLYSGITPNETIRPVGFRHV